MTAIGVGDHLQKILLECGIVAPEGCPCIEFMNQMNGWGVSGCQAHRWEILTHLQLQSKGRWLDMVNVAIHGYLNVGQLLDESIRRASQV